MVKQLLLILPILLTVACARPANKEAQLVSASVGNPVQSSNLLWQHHGGNLGATNVVEGRLPSDGSIETGDTQSGFNIYCAPLVVEIDGNQHVYALWANRNTLKVVKYIYSGGKLTTDSEFSSITLISSNKHNAHQMAVTIKDNEPILFVAHSGGITRYNGLTGKTLHTYTAANNVYRLTITDNILIAQSATTLLKLNANTLDPSAGNNTHSVDNYHPTKQLPLVISGDSVFFEHENEVKKLHIKSFDNMLSDNANNTFDFKETMDGKRNGPGITEEINHLKTPDATISAMSAITFENTATVVYATVRHFGFQHNDQTSGLVNTTNDTGFFIFGKSQDDTFNFNRSRQSNAPIGSYSRYCRQFDNYSGLYAGEYLQSFEIPHNPPVNYRNTKLLNQQYVSACAFGAGDATFTPLAVNNTELFLPGVYWNKYNCNVTSTTIKHHCDGRSLTGIQRVKNEKGEITSAFESKTHELEKNTNQASDIAEALANADVDVDFYYTNRFVIHDDTNNVTFTIANISNYFFENPEDSRNPNTLFVDFLQDHKYPSEICKKTSSVFKTCEDEAPLANANVKTYQEIIPGNITQLKNYNSKIIVGTSGHTFFDKTIGSENASINTVSVGRGVVFIADDQNNLHYFHQ
jgi:hypothetical protein